MSNYDSQWKEQFSNAYLLAITSQAGWKIASWNVDKDLMDATIETKIEFTDGRYKSHKVDLQLKCTDSPVTNTEKFISYQICKEHIEHIKKRVLSDPFYFILIHVPKEKEKWVEHIKENIDFNTILRNCGFHYEIISSNMNELKPTLQFQKNSIFSAEFLKNSISEFDTFEKYREYLNQRMKINT
ncbi:DUF4365 domain-containing protein [Silvanigrella sp.]|jgi:hypothetical protein|uniref:DUF4365 domain-containing protein n=1 Tax=Silvanigrella sp. TaxID=2024976 RepID=UPI0037C94E71